MINRIKNWFIAIYNIAKQNELNSSRFDYIVRLNSNLSKSVDSNVAVIYKSISESNYDCRDFVLLQIKSSSNKIKDTIKGHVDSINSNLHNTNEQLGRSQGRIADLFDAANESVYKTDMILRNLAYIIKPPQKGQINNVNVKFLNREFKSTLKVKDRWVIRYTDHYKGRGSNEDISVDGILELI